MNKKMLIDASYKEETRVVILDGNYIEGYDIENSAKKQIKGNIYLAKVIRIEPSLQAAFVDYGGNRHGFLAFNEIHPDYYQIPVADRKKLLEIQELNKMEEEPNPDQELDPDQPSYYEDMFHSHNSIIKNYKIQEVIHKRQIILVQVVKEERGNKGAALTTYLSLAGRYCVLMPNSLRNGGISRKITSPSERKRLKDIITELNIPSHMGMIIRTAGAQCPKADTLKDGEYLLHLWDEIRNLTMKSIAPALIYEDSNLLKLTLRDNYTQDINEILIDGEDAWSQARDYMRALMPQNVHKLHLWRDQKQSLFSYYKVENLIDQMLSPIVQLKSGGYLVINQTEALVAIDVNSGRSIKEKDLEETALRTNQEAANEIARQLRLRDLAGLIVIDFIDMENKKHNYIVERRLKSLLHKDRARIQIGSISSFGLLEMTRQRLRPSIAEFAFTPCSACNGTGIIRSDANISLQIIRQIDEEARKIKPGILTVSISSGEIALNILNQKRRWLADIEKKYKIKIEFTIDSTLSSHNVRFSSKTDSSLDMEPDDEMLQSTPNVIQENLFVREIPIQSYLEYQTNSKTDYRQDEIEDKVIDLKPESKALRQNSVSIELKQNDTNLDSYSEQYKENKKTYSNSRDKRQSHHSRRNRYKKGQGKAQKNNDFTPILEAEPIPEAVINEKPEEITVTPTFVSIEIDADKSRNQHEETESLINQVIDNSDAVNKEDETSDNLEIKEEKPAPKRRRATKTTKSTGTTKTTRKKASSKKESKENETEEKSDNKEEKETKIKKTTRARKTTTAKKTTVRKPKKTKEADENNEQPLIQPIVIDDTPTKTPRSGWWKR